MRETDKPIQATGLVRIIPILLFAGGVALCLHYSPVHRQLSFDNQIYFYIAERVASGEAPHLSLVDHKHQLASLLSGWSMAAGRMVGVQDYLAARVLSIAAAAACLPLLWGIGLRLGRSLWTANFAALAMLGFVDFFYQGTMGLRPKVFMVFFLVLALYASAKRRHASAGAAATASFLCWQPALVVTVALGVANGCAPSAESGTSRAKRLVVFMLGASAVFALYESYFAWHGALREQLYQSYLMAIDPGAYKYHSIVSTLRFIIHMGLWRHDAGMIYPLTALGVLAALWLRALSHRRLRLRALADRPEFFAVLLYGHGALLFTFIDRQAYPDMFFLYPFFALTIAVGLSAVVENLQIRGREPVATGGALLVSVLMAVLPWTRLGVFPTAGKTIESQEKAAQELDIVHEQYGSIWAIGCPHLLAFNNWRNASPFGLLIDRRVQAYMDRTTMGEPLRAVRSGTMPGAILLSRGGYGGRLLAWIRRNYTEVTNRSFARQGIRLWVVRFSSMEATAGRSVSTHELPARR